MHELNRLDETIDLGRILERIATVPQLDRSLSAETSARLPLLVGGIALALARSFTIIDSELTNPSTKHWERAFRLFDLVL